MPLRFRSVVPYTLPGVLALIGWWWYISRKKERPISHDSPEGAPNTMGLRTSSAEGSNGLLEKGTVSPTNNTEHPTLIPAKISNQRTEHKINSHVQDTEATSSQNQSSDEAAPYLGRIRPEEIHELLVSALPGKEDTVVLSLTSAEKSSSPGPTQELEKLLPVYTVEEVAILPCQSTLITSTPPPTAHLSDAERPEPEGEVAKHNSIVNTHDEMVVWSVTPAKVQSAIPSDSLDNNPPSAPDFHHPLQTSTPSLPAAASADLTVVHDSTSKPVTAGDIQAPSGIAEEEEEELERLASGLISKVILAATDEVLGITSCQVTDSSQPGCSDRPCSQQESTSAVQQHQHLLSVEMTDKGEQGMPNGCSSQSHRVHQTNDPQRGQWPTPLHQAAQSPPLLNVKLKAHEADLLAKDSAYSTCHSECGISNEDLQDSTLDNQLNVIQVTDLSAREAAPSQSPVEAASDEMVLPETEENSVEAVCEIKRLNGMGLRNGAQGTSEAETDQSGGSDVNSMDSVDSSCAMSVRESQSNHSASSNSELIIWEIEVPKHLVGRLIGKQGRYVSFLKQNSGAKIYISTLPYTQEFQICHIEGTQQQVDKALSLIGKKFKDLDLTNLYAPPPPPLTLPSLPMTSWLLLPSGVTVEVIVVNIVSAGHVFVQQHTHPTYHALRSLDQQMFLCYSQPGTPALPSPAEVGVICAAPAAEGAWWRAQVITFYKETNDVEIRYVDYGGYDRVKIDSLRQIRSDFVTLPFQGAEVLLDNIAPLPGEDRFSSEATSALEEMTRGVALLAQVSNYDNNTGLPLVHLWNMVGDEIISVNRMLAERGLGVWMDGF